MFLSIVSLLLICSAVVRSQNVVSIDTPQVNERVWSKQLFNITYTIIGTQTTNPPFANYYPISLSVDFVWQEHGSTASPISLQAATGLDTSPYPGGTKNVQHKASFRVPNCHFFSRYHPGIYDFSLVFTPIYAPPTVNGVVGVAQDRIVTPLSITVDNSTFPRC